MLIDLADAEPATSGGKAAVLARLLQAGMPVPPGFVVPTAVYEEAVRDVDLTDTDAAQQLGRAGAHLRRRRHLPAHSARLAGPSASRRGRALLGGQ